MPRHLRLSVALLVLSVARPVAADEALIGGRNKVQWLELAKDTNPRKREAAVVALAILGPTDRNVLDTYRELAQKDATERVRLKVISVVQDMDKEKSLRPLVPTLADLVKDDKSPAVRAAAAGALGKAGDLANPAVPSLRAALKDADANVRAAAADALARVGLEGKLAIAELTELLKDADTGVRLAAVFALGRLAPEGAKATDRLADLLTTDKDANVRKETARSLGLLGVEAKAAVPALAKALKEDKETDVRRQSAIALGKMVGEIKPVANTMLDVLKTDADKSVRVLAVQALSTGLAAGLKDYLKDLSEQMSKDPEGDVRLAIVQEVGNLGPEAKDALPALLKATTDVQISIREAAKVAVKKVKG